MTTNTTETADPLLTVAQVAGLLGIAVTTVYDLIAERAFDVHRYGRAIRVRESVARAYLDRTLVPAKPEGAPRDADTTAPPRSTYAQEAVA